MHFWLEKNDIISKIRLIGAMGRMRPEGYVFNKDLWRLNINEANSLSKFINIIRPFIKHRKRAKDINICIKNILKRKERGTIS